MQCQNFSDPCAKSGENKKLGWSHDGVIAVTIVGNQNRAGIIANNYSLANWMSFLDDHKFLSQLTIPGTHDSGALYGGDLVKCQNLSFSEQLDLGIRFLDVRCRHIDNSFAIHHGMVYQNQNFNGVLNACYSFLNNHPGETIFMCVKHEYDDKNVSRSFEETFNDYIGNSFDKWYLKNDIPVLKDIRGKIVLLRRFNANSPIGIQAHGNWNDNDTFSWNIQGTDKTVSVQDAYKVNTLFNIGDKWSKVKDLLDKTSQNNGKTLFINFTSGVSAGAYPYSVAYQNNGINRRLQQYLLEAERKQLGVFAMDFPERPTGSLIPLLVKTNF
ncbi:hypothetical protein RM51_11010 [Chryseobacterium taiwanense]|uniref:1-phosphatidylinositol phosphodiesterase n=1 Tax=Chryseobacterium taiwanense TaxID=363331 RepID=A0A0B4E876_9FLAO|nr:hypothetical protein RM51_11010 [Chryseobacterium taiwanense]